MRHWLKSAWLNLPMCMLISVLISDSKKGRNYFFVFPSVWCRSVHLWCIGRRVLALTYLCMLSWSPTAKVVLICDSKKGLQLLPLIPITAFVTAEKGGTACRCHDEWLQREGAQRTTQLENIFLSHILTKSKHSETNHSELLLLSWWVTAKRGEGAQRTQAVTSVAWVIFLSHILTTSKHSETNPSCLTWVRGGEKPYNCEQCNYWSGTLKKYTKTKDT